MTITIEILQQMLEDLLDKDGVDYQTPIHIVSPDGYISDIKGIDLDGNGHAYIDPIQKGHWRFK